MEDTVQQWDGIWTTRTVRDEIEMADFYSGRQFILKYLPRHGTSLEAGCGLGRYVFYLADLGFQVTGTEVSSTALDKCREWALQNGYDARMFKRADVRSLPYPDSSLAGYISLGVIEHFEEGPEKALDEAFRVLMPGGVAIISTPNKYSLEYLYYNVAKYIKTPVKFILKLMRLYQSKKNKEHFFQYEYAVTELAGFIKKAGFVIADRAVIGMKFPIYELLKQHNRLNIFRRLRPVLFLLTDLLETSPLKVLGGLGMVIARKPAGRPACFFCGSMCNNDDHFRVPVCTKCESTLPSDILRSYGSDSATSFKRTTELAENSGAVCIFCRKNPGEVGFFGETDYGFSVSVCRQCLRDPAVNLKLANFYIRENWREWGR